MRSFAAFVAVLVLLPGAAAPASAELASLVADLAVGTGANPSSNPHGFVRLGDRVVFFAGGDAGGEDAALWATDGTAEGTRRLAPAGHSAEGLGRLGGAYLWLSSSYGGALWRTGGTPATTYPLVPDVASYDDAPARWARVGDELYFFRLAATGWELWATDGTAGGTRAVAALPPAQRAAVAAAHDGRLFFVTGERGPGGGHVPLRDFRLWESDGTASGTRMLRELPGGEPVLRSTRGGLLLFVDGGPWVSDGTRRGTGPLFAPPGEPGFGPDRVLLATPLDGRLLFFDSGDESGWDLWISDATARGTRVLTRDLAPGGGSADLPAAVLGGRLLFTAYGEGGLALWSTGGTAASTMRVAEVCAEPCFASFDSSARAVAAIGDRVVFLADDGVHGVEPWATDGTPAGSHLVADACPGPCGVEGGLGTVGGEALFFAHDPAGGFELWASDGTAAGTRRLAELSPQPPPGSGGFQGQAPAAAVLGDRVVAVGWDRRGGHEPWAFDRAGGGGTPLGDLATGGEPGAQPISLTALGDRLLFVSCRDATARSTAGTAESTVELAALPGVNCFFNRPPPTSAAGGRGYLVVDGDLWSTDGSAAGSVRLTDFGAAFERQRVSSEVVGHAGQAVFAVSFGSPSSVAASELWATDGTPEGTRNLGLGSFPGPVTNLASLGGELYFRAFDAIVGPQVWAADSTLTEARRLTAIPAANFPFIEPPGFVRAGGLVYFVLQEDVTEGGSSHFEHHLWRSDGTPQGTAPLPSPSAGGVPQTPVRIAALPQTPVLVTRSDDNLRLSRVWAIGGAGSAEPLLGLGSDGFVQEVVTRGEELLLLTYDRSAGPAAWRLWRTDGAAAGTVELADLTALGLAGVRGLTAAGGWLFFTAASAADGAELWVSDGTQATTRRLQDIAPGPAGSSPDELTVAGSRLYFAADDGLHGRELWSLPLAGLGPPCRPAATALCLGDGRFRAELFRQDRTGERGGGRAVPWSSAAGAFWFYRFGNPEAAVKMVDGSVVNGHQWLFYGPLTDAHVALTVTDLATGDARRWPAAPGPLGDVADLGAFTGAEPAGSAPTGPENRLAAAAEEAAVTPGAQVTACLPSATRLCLHGGRFAAELVWRDLAGVERPARAFAHGDQAGYFAFYGGRDLQAVLKLLDGRTVNGHFWLFATPLTHLGYTLTLTDGETGAVYSYPKPAGGFSRVVDLTSVR